MLITPKRPAVSGLLSTFNLAIFSLSPISPSSSSNTGAIILHGPHQGAQKSTSTVPDFTSSEKFWSVTSTMAIVLPPSFTKFQSAELSIPLRGDGSKVFRRPKKGREAEEVLIRHTLSKNSAAKIGGSISGRIQPELNGGRTWGRREIADKPPGLGS